MKKLVNYSLAFAIGSMSIFSCRQRDVVAPTVVQQSNTPNGTRSYNLSISVLPDATKGNKIEGLKGAIVTISQGTGNVQSVKTDEIGIANFSGLNEGEVTWYVAADSTLPTKYAKRTGTVDVSVSSLQSPNQSNQVGAVAATVILPQLTATLAGKIVGNFDFISGNALSGDVDMIVRVDYGTSFEPNFYSTKTGADGSFTISNLPATSGTVTGYVTKKNGSDAINYEFKRNITFQAQRITDIGAVEATTLNSIGSATITGIAFGDFTFVDRSRLDGRSNTDTVPSATADSYANANTLPLSSLPGWSAANYLKAGVIVEATFTTGVGSGQPSVYSTVTDASGRFTLPNVPVGNYNLSAKTQSAPAVAPRAGADFGLIRTYTLMGSKPSTNTTANFINDIGTLPLIKQ